MDINIRKHTKNLSKTDMNIRKHIQKNQSEMDTLGNTYKKKIRVKWTH